MNINLSNLGFQVAGLQIPSSQPDGASVATKQADLSRQIQGLQKQVEAFLANQATMSATAPQAPVPAKYIPPRDIPALGTPQATGLAVSTSLRTIANQLYYLDRRNQSIKRGQLSLLNNPGYQSSIAQDSIHSELLKADKTRQDAFVQLVPTIQLLRTTAQSTLQMSPDEIAKDNKTFDDLGGAASTQGDPKSDSYRLWEIHNYLMALANRLAPSYLSPNTGN